MPIPRQAELRRRRTRRAKLAKLRRRYMAAKTEEEKAWVLQKVQKIAPWLTKEQFLAPITNGAR
ncbi:MAG: hypothetical protein D6736_14420 [Nitrospinota bacterium]|nr:MAG: hypothetical protein D6736_14420 [Nitrospinota bacterium]